MSHSVLCARAHKTRDAKTQAYISFKYIIYPACATLVSSFKMLKDINLYTHVYYIYVPNLIQNKYMYIYML